MATTSSNPEKDTDVPNQDARTERTCEICGETDDRVERTTFQNEDVEPVIAHDLCAPPMHRFREWARRRDNQ
jgi:hypothetical protein